MKTNYHTKEPYSAIKQVCLAALLSSFSLLASSQDNGFIYSNTYIHINSGPYIFVSNGTDQKTENTIYLIGSNIEIYVPVAEKDYAIKKVRSNPSQSHRDIFEAWGLEYRLFLNNKRLKDWTAISDLEMIERDTIWESKTADEKKFSERDIRETSIIDSRPAVGDERILVGVPFGKKVLFHSPLAVNDSLFIEVRLKGKGTTIYSTTVKRLPIRPFLTYTLQEKDIDSYFLKDKNLTESLKAKPESKLSSVYLMSKWDSLPTSVSLSFPSHSKKLLFKFAEIIQGEDSVLYLRFGKSNDSLLRSEKSTSEVLLNNLESGSQYTLSVNNINQPENTVRYLITIEPAWYQTSIFKWSTGIALALLLFSYLYLLYQNKVKKNNREKARIDLELKGIRSQLNPHFVFNSLNSIQSLVNADEKEKANQYLSDFSKLMRETLGGNNKEFIPLETELSILDRYLKLEQLRFGFQYTISVNEAVKASSIEIPALLLQPLVENAVKHGVSELLEKGRIKINVSRDSSDLIISISDNGKGFVKEPTTENGFGIRLTQERIKLLNQMNRNNPIAISFDKTKDGMVVNLIFKDIC